MATTRALLARSTRIGAVGAAHLLPVLPAALVKAVRGDRAAARRLLYRRLTTLLMRLGPTFVKAGRCSAPARRAAGRALRRAVGAQDRSTDDPNASLIRF
ncbi:hypothetical protein MCBG_01961 [Micromonospora sp. M42]|uniref:hypothetical protein n=1 Tax=Micromonospora sp. M42 TaxID=457406 RepID=UPI0003EECF23|nr:hypothetical protein [Micromonospora sp. M42]EWM64828.1 hypothetical protein MCBG_01961 [Micromonospora sp. M42]